MSLFGLAKSQPAKPAQKGQFLKWPPEHFTVVYTLCISNMEPRLLGFQLSGNFLRRDHPYNEGPTVVGLV